MNMFGKIERLGIARPFRFYDFNNSRDDFARLFDYHRVANADVFAFDFVFVVQCRAPNSASAYEHRLQHRHWRENSSASDLNHDLIEACLHPFSFVFVSYGPTRRFRGEPEALALRK